MLLSNNNNSCTNHVRLRLPTTVPHNTKHSRTESCSSYRNGGARLYVNICIDMLAMSSQQSRSQI